MDSPQHTVFISVFFSSLNLKAFRLYYFDSLT